MIRTAALVLLCVPAFAHSEVYEYGRDGSVTIKDGSGPAQQPQATSEPRRTQISASRAGYRNLAEQVALRHAGGAGPRRAGLDAMTFARVVVELIRAESAFNPRALSPKGAQGLGQLMPATARMLGVRDPWKPEQNLDGAVRYFSAQLARFGSVPLALAAYNAGPHRVVEYDGIPPFRETRAYVAKITAAVGALPPTDRVSEPLRQGHPVVSTKNPKKDLSVWQY